MSFAANIPVHVVSLNRRVGKARLLKLTKAAETAGEQIGADMRTALSTRKHGSSSQKEKTRAATAQSMKSRSIAREFTIVDIANFISGDPARRTMSRRELVEALNAAGLKTTRGNRWTVGALTRPLRKAKEHIQLQEEPDEGPIGFDT